MKEFSTTPQKQNQDFLKALNWTPLKLILGDQKQDLVKRNDIYHI